MAENVIATSSLVSNKALIVLQNMLPFTNNVSRAYEPELEMGSYAHGNTINIKRPAKYSYRSGRVANPQTTTETTIPLTLSQGGSDLSFTTNERTTGLSMQSLEEKIAAAMVPIASEIERQGLQMAAYATYNMLNPTYAVPNTQDLAVDAATSLTRRLDEMLAPDGDQRYLTMSPALNAGMIRGLAGLQNSASRIGKQYETGIMQNALGLNYHKSQLIPTHTNGAATATNVNGANQTGSSVTVTAVAAGTLTKGTRITWPGVYAVNAVTGQSTGVLAQFIVTSDVAQGATSIPFSPAIVTTGVFKNASASPTTGQPYVIFGNASTSYTESLAYHRDAFTFASVPMDTSMKKTHDVKQVRENGISIRVIDGYDQTNDAMVMRLDVLFGWASPYAELACGYAL